MSPRVTVLAFFLLACGGEETFGTPDVEVCAFRRDLATRYCIEVYEAARKDASTSDAGSDQVSPPISLPSRLPWTNATWQEARDACASKGKRLCERDEWLDACDGAVGEDQGTTYCYGNEAIAARCNTVGLGPEPVGQRSDCRSTLGTYDQSGNVREWTGGVRTQAAARGGSWTSSQTHECKSGDTVQLIAPENRSLEVGFRCCRDE